MNTKVTSGLWAVCMLATASAAEAGCSRAIEVPMAPVGVSVSFDGDRSSGIYPTLLRELGTSTGCEFQIQRVPRARLQKMFESGQADLLMPASVSPSRDRDGEFVPLVQVRASLVTLAREEAVPRSLAELIAQPDLKLAVVRGFSFGSAYEGAVAALRQQKRLIEESNVAGVARALRQGLAQGTIMTASIFIGTLTQEAELTPLVKQVRIEPLDELGWSESGVYLSRRTLGDADRRQLRQAFTQVARSGRVWQLLSDNHPPGSLSGSIRPLP
ncbi:ABC transporter substrate-binding protein [Roseateles sp.]|uniref:substrate-binding periplasmic protein n=1 Tax=Roseateles sp. TaxID=1971397 RepID=UPI0025E5AF90|nr:transporter substrate-binding domain-containing protein [Roseateles sp.]MBV8035525.1 transporter substrate-binding domain-containing protein [Roseateles sp.]